MPILRGDIGALEVLRGRGLVRSFPAAAAVVDEGGEDKEEADEDDDDNVADDPSGDAGEPEASVWG